MQILSISFTCFNLYLQNKRFHGLVGYLRGVQFSTDLNPIYTTEKISKARMKISKGNFHFRQGKGKMCSLHTSVLPLLVLF